eukprot:gene13827-15272_t
MKKKSLRVLRYSNKEPEQDKTSVSSWRVWLSWTTVKTKGLLLATKDAVRSWKLWRANMKVIGGHFGNGVLSYFTFLRWLFILNVCIGLLLFIFVAIPAMLFNKLICMEPTVNGTIHYWSYPETVGDASLGYYSASNCRLEEEKLKQEIHTNANMVKNVMDFFQGSGWMNMTVMFYGSYENAFHMGFNDWVYNMPLAYMLTTFVCLLLSLYLIISSAVNTFEQSHIKEGRHNEYSFSNKIFGSWDMCITSEETAKLTSCSIVRELEADIIEAERQSKEEERTTRQQYCIKAIRVIINIVILLLLILGGLAIYQATKWSIEETNTNTKQWITTMLSSYASQITITAVNVLLPAIFYNLSSFEDYDPRTKINIDLGRTVLVKLASIAVLLGTVYRRISKERNLCWENIVGGEMYKLLWTEFIVMLAVTVFVEYPRSYIGRNVDLGCKLNEKIGMPEFSIPDNVLTLVYGQTIIWVGTLFSPLLPIMGSVSLFMVFHIKRISLMHNFVPPKTPYRAGKSNYFFMLLQLVSLALSLVATIYAVTQVTPSTEHGPFRGFRRMYNIIALTVASLPPTYNYIFYLLFSPVVVVSIVLLLCVALHFSRAMASMYSRKAKDLELHLAIEQKEKRDLLRYLAVTGDKRALDHEVSIEIQEDLTNENDDDEPEITA